MAYFLTVLTHGYFLPIVPIFPIHFYKNVEHVKMKREIQQTI